jgi:hypothetical protein
MQESWEIWCANSAKYTNGAGWQHTRLIDGIGSAEYIQDGGINVLSFNENVVPVSDNDGHWALVPTGGRKSGLCDGTINTSDARDKTNIRDLNYGMKEIMQLRPIRFDWKDNADAGVQLGVIAQEIQKVLPKWFVTGNIKPNEGTNRETKIPSAKLGVHVCRYNSVLIRGMQEAAKRR